MHLLFSSVHVNGRFIFQFLTVTFVIVIGCVLECYINPDIVAKTYKHIFEDKHNLYKGYDYFDEDYYIAESFRRLRTNVDIQEHDIILLRHEALEFDIMQENPDMPYEEAHAMAEKAHNYKKALIDWMKKEGR